MKNRLKDKGSRLKIYDYIRLKFMVISLFTVVLLVLLVNYGLHKFGKEFLPIKQVVFIGNKHISENELKTLSGITLNAEVGPSDMINISAKSIKSNLLKSPWIKNVSIRRDFPDTLKIRVFETEPFAILEMKGKPFLIDEGGRLLEELKGEAVPFLPVILSDPFNNKDSFAEAINLAKVLRDRNIAKERNRVEIIANRDKESMAVLIDGVLIKVGYGNYGEKIGRLFELEDEIRKRALAIEYIDLRFSDNVIVKPVKEVVR